MNKVSVVYNLTKDLYQLVLQPVNKDNREEIIEQINELLNKRELELENVNFPLSKNEEESLREISVWNQTINTKFLEMKQQIQKDMIQLKKKKNTNQIYTNPYQNVATSDGRFYDKKK